MDMVERQPGDVEQLSSLIRGEKDAQQRDRYRVIVLAIAGEPTKAVQDKVGRSRGFVQRWAYAYRDGGIDAINVKKASGAQSKLTPAQELAFKQRILDGPTERDAGVCTLRGRDARRILEQEFGKKYSLPGVYDLLHRLGLSPLRPRPTHRKSDPAAQQQWVEDAPFLSRK